MNHTRTPVTTKEILKYLKLRSRRLYEGTVDDRITKREQDIQRISLSTSDNLIPIIVNDKILKENNKLQKSLYSKPKHL